MANQVAEKKTPRRTTRQRNAPDRYGEYAAADSSGPAEPREKRHKISATSHIPKAAEEQPSATNDDEHVTPSAGNASKKRRRTPQPALPLTPHTSPAEASQAGSGSSAGIKRYFKTKLPDEENAQADVLTSPPQLDPAVEDDVSSDEEESNGEETSKAAGKKAIRRAGNASGKKAVTDRSDTRPLPDGEPPVWALVRGAVLYLPFSLTYDVDRVGKLSVRHCHTIGQITLLHIAPMERAWDFYLMVVVVCAAI